MFSLQLPQSANQPIAFSLSCLILNMAKDVFCNPDCYGIVWFMCSLFLNHAFLNEGSQMLKDKSFFSSVLGNLFFNCTGCQRSTKDNETMTEQFNFSKLSENVTDETAAVIIQNVLSMEIYI